jgi:HK97 family phage major capsid protein
MLNEQVANELATFLREHHHFASTTDLDKKITDIFKRTEDRQRRGDRFSISSMVRGALTLQGITIPPPPGRPDTREQDVNLVKALTTGATPGSYLVPEIQAAEILEYLNDGGVARAAGFRRWPMSGVQKVNVPIASTAPSWVWMAQNSIQTATDPGLGQMAFDLKERRALVQVPIQLLAVSIPAFDTTIAELLGQGAAEHEDVAIFAASTVSNGPTAMMAASGITFVNCAGSANGGNMGYSDILAVLQASAAAKAKGPFVWLSSPRTYFSRILGLVDTTSRPLVIPTLTQGLQTTRANVGVRPVGMLMGYPIFVTSAIPENETLGSGSNQSHLVFTNPRYCHIAEDDQVEVAVSTERFFDAAQVAIRGIAHTDTGYAPAAGIVILRGIN